VTAALPANTPALKRAFRRMVMNLYYAGTLKHSEKSILMTLATFMGRGGLYPSHEAIAEASNYAVRTVIRALDRAYELGIVERLHRTVRKGNKMVRTSNMYRLIVDVAQQARVASLNMGRAVLRAAQRAVSLSDRMAEKVSQNLFLRGKSKAQPPQMTRQEMIDYCYAHGDKSQT